MSEREEELVDCLACEQIGSCCRFGVEVDIEEAKKILSLELLGKFYRMEIDEDYPSGYVVHTSINDSTPCSFRCADGLCAIHRLNYDLKPTACKEFPDKDTNAHYQYCYKLKKEEMR